jgi:hypothetical protein
MLTKLLRLNPLYVNPLVVDEIKKVVIDEITDTHQI